ncbi:anion permease [Desulfovibrio mangrovi]|uniref:SLC13 family permease n=1 Tax=Desulfovibrio mangrovi TaxID=2976983 RepID=UPI002247C53F|nr:SLC13 family permease [Desulfovibrio mangrovi]UZP66068.1 anion permease [Desulfovibrio mangrovi]
MSERLHLPTDRIIAIIITIAATAIWLLKPVAASGIATPNADSILSVMVFTMGMWVCGVLPEYLTTLIFFSIMMLGGLAPAAVVFAGFSSSAFWLVFAGLVLGLSVRESGLGKRLAVHLGALCGSSYLTILAAMAAFGLVLSFLMPSAVGRVVLMIPILNAFAESRGYKAGSKGAGGILMAGAAGTMLPAFTILPSNVANMVLSGTMEALYGTVPTYGQYMLIHFPVLGLVKMGLIIAVAALLFREKPSGPPAQQETLPPVSPAERRLMLLLISALLLWMTDAVHGIAPAWVGLAAAVLCLVPKAGMLKEGAFSRLGFASLFYVAGVIGLGAVVREYQLGVLGAQAVLDVFPLTPGADAWNYAVLAGTSTLTCMLTTTVGVPAVMTPMGPELAAASGLTLMTVLMTQTIGFSSIFLPYQAPAIVVAAQMSNLPTRAVNSYFVTLFLLTILLIVPANYFWWKLLGML